MSDQLNAEGSTEEIIEALSDSHDAGVFVVDTAAGGIVKVNTNALEMLEMPEEAVIGKVCSYFLKSASEKPLLPSDTPVQGVLKIFRGRSIPVIISTAECALGKHTGIIHTFTRLQENEGEEPSKTAQAEEILVETEHLNSLSFTEETLRLIIESVQDAILVMNDEKRISFVNSSACRMFGYSADEMLKKNLHKLIAPGRYIDSFSKGFENFRDTGEGVVVGRSIEIEALRKDGKTFPVELSISSIPIDNRWHAVGIVKDFTEKKDAEKQIVIAREAAENAYRAKSEFLANAGNEIRTPLNFIIETTELMNDKGMSDEQIRYLELIRSSSKSLLALVNSILDISKLEDGTIVLKTIPFNVRDAIRNAVYIFTRRAADKNIELDYGFAENVPEYLKGDPDRLIQIIVNLTGNSIKFTDSGSVKVFVNVKKMSKNSAVLDFAVTDTGIGIPPSKLESIRNNLSLADSSIRRILGIPGLGLAMSNQLVKLMKGEFSVESKLDKGSTFSFTAEFGLHHGTEFRESEKPSTEEQDGASENDLRNPAILLVDDSPDSRFLVKAFLRKKTCLIVEAENGAEAVEKFKEKKWDVILMDIQMPIMDGYIATERIRKIEREKGLEHTPVIALTAHSKNAEIKKCLDVGCDFHLAKPVSKNALLKYIGELTGEVSPEDTDDNQRNTSETNGDSSFDPDLRKLIPGYIKRRREDVEILRDLLKKSEYKEIERCGHRMKGSGSGYGFNEISLIGAFIEKAGRAESIRRIEEGINKLQYYIENIQVN